MNEKIRAIILGSIEIFNEELGQEKLKADQDTAIFGQGSELDSLDFVNLMVIIEEEVFEHLGKTITIASEKAFSKKYNPFKNVTRLSEFIEELIKED